MIGRYKFKFAIMTWNIHLYPDLNCHQQSDCDGRPGSFCSGRRRHVRIPVLLLDDTAAHVDEQVVVLVVGLFPSSAHNWCPTPAVAFIHALFLDSKWQSHGCRCQPFGAWATVPKPSQSTDTLQSDSQLTTIVTLATRPLTTREECRWLPKHTCH
jgi:hypothetical protein